MPSILAIHRRSNDSSGGISNGTVLLVGAVIVSISALALLVGVGYHYLKKRKSRVLNGYEIRESMQETQQAPRPTSWIFSRARLTASIIMPKPAANREILSSRRSAGLGSNGTVDHPAVAQVNANIVRHHEANNEIPLPFSGFLENFGSDPAGGDGVSFTEKPPLSPPGLKRHSVSSNYSVSVSVGRTRNSPRSDSISSQGGSQRPTIHHSVASLDGPSRASFLSIHSQHSPGPLQPPNSPFRRNFPLDPLDTSHSRGHSTASSVATTRSALIYALNAKSGMRKTALRPFQHLLPDELDVKVGDQLSLLQTFDDGWCICVAEEPAGSASNSIGDIRMGCVPLWVFERMPKGKEGASPMRTMRSTSLAITVEVSPPSPGTLAGPAAPWDRTNTISWSNF